MPPRIFTILFHQKILLFNIFQSTTKRINILTPPPPKCWFKFNKISRSDLSINNYVLFAQPPLLLLLLYFYDYCWTFQRKYRSCLIKIVHSLINILPPPPPKCRSDLSINSDPHFDLNCQWTFRLIFWFWFLSIFSEAHEVTPCRRKESFNTRPSCLPSASGAFAYDRPIVQRLAAAGSRKRDVTRIF
jgi:hypothetical protein